MKRKSGLLRSILITGAFLLLATIISMFFQSLEAHENISAIYIFAVFVISLMTESSIYGIISALVSTLIVNYAFTYPFYNVNFIIPANLSSAVIMTGIAVLTGMLTAKIKKHEANKAEGERERARANLLRAVSHDIRTPLTTIYAASSTLLENDSLSQEQRQSILVSVREDCGWLKRMVENLLSITGIGSGSIEIIKTPTVLDELIDSVMGKFTKRYPGQELTLDIPDNIIVIPMDAILIEQVLLNILENAVLHASGMKNLTLRVYTVNRRAVFEIEDDGCGISEERLKNILSGYYTTDGENTKGKRSSGIGLSVCSTIIKAHGGTISAENRKSGGAIFRFTLDREDEGDDEQ